MLVFANGLSHAEGQSLRQCLPAMWGFSPIGVGCIVSLPNVPSKSYPSVPVHVTIFGNRAFADVVGVR